MSFHFRRISLLLLALGGLGWGSGGDGLRLLVLGDGESLALGSETVEHVTALSAGESIGMVGHVGGNLALVALRLQSLDLAGSLNVVVLEERELSGLVLVRDLLGLGVDLLLSLSLTAIKSDESVDAALGLEASLLDSHRLVKLSSVEHKSVDWEFNSLLNLRSKHNEKNG